MPITTSCNTCGKSLTHPDHGGLCGVCLFHSLMISAEEDKPDALPPGSWRVDGYVVGEVIGRGGAAVVYRAREFAPSREVALKILRPAWTDGTAVRERFRLEAEALAQLDHPGILPVLASGEVDGAPWYTMPLAAGGTLAQRMESARGQFRQIAEWLAGAAEAVAHAHARGVLHRDLKPGNLLFAADGRLFVSDFGLARVLATPSDVTVTSALLGTPAYMAPEVITRGIRAATVAADVWGLGAILYELLAARRPFAGESIPDLVRAIANDEPAPLRAVPRDLAAIAFRALHKNPEKRYATVQAMADDLRAWLEGRPIVARPYPWRERVRFASKRHPWAAGGIALAVVVAVAATLIGVRETSLRRQEQAARTAANQEAATSREILKFLQNDLLAQASPDTEPDRDIKLRTVLDRAAKSIDGRFPQQPLVEAAVRETLAWTYFALGERAVAAKQSVQAIGLFAREKGPGAVEVMRLRYFEAFDDLVDGKMAEATSLAAQALAAQRRLLPPSKEEIYVTWQLLITIYIQAGKPDQAEKMAREAWAAATKNLGPDHTATIQMEYILARALAEQQRRESLPFYRHSLEQARRVLGKDNSLTMLILSDFSVALGNMGDAAEYLAMRREVLEVDTRVLGRQHPDTAVALVNLATALGRAGKLQQAAPLFEEADQTFIKLYGREDRRTLRFETNLIQYWFQVGKYREGTELGARNLAIYERLLGPEHPDTFLLTLRLCLGYAGLGEFDTVIKLAQSLVEVSKRIHGPNSDYTLMSKLTLANAQRDLGQYEAAEALYQEVDSLLPTALGNPNAITLLSERFQAQLAIRRGRFEQAESSLRRTLVTHEKQYGSTDDRTLSCKADLAGLLLRRNAAPEAEQLLREIVAVRERDAGLQARPTLAALDALGVALALQGLWPEAEATLRRSGEYWKGLEPDGWREALNRVSLGWLLYANGHPVDAAPLLEAGYATATSPAKLSPGERVLRAVVVARIVEAYREAGDLEAAAKWQAIAAL